MAIASQLTFRFGVELEFLLGSRSKKHKSWTALAGELSACLAQAGVANHVNAGGEKTAENYREWSIVREVTVPADVSKGFWGTELVSPILSPSMPPGSGDNSQQHWVATLQTIFAVLTGHFVLAPTTQAGTHVHVSCEPAVLATNGAGALAAVAKAALYFEPALDALMPASRSSGGKDGGGSPYWCQSNRASVALKGLSGGLESCFALLDECYAAGAGGAEPIVRAMCLFPASSAYGRAHGYKADFVHGVYKWDFSGLLPDTGSGTLEYRQCPGSRTADEARAWVELGLCFVAGAIDTGHTLDPLAQQHRQQVGEGGNLMEDLWWMLCAGAQAAGVGELEGIRAMDFTGGSGGGAKGVKAKNEKK